MATSDPISQAISGFLILGLIAAYFLPWIVAVVRKSPYQVPILLINLFLGWTALGWVAALVWASMPRARRV